MSAQNVGRDLALAMAANTLGITAHMTYMYYLAPIALRAGGMGGDAVLFSLVAVAMGALVLPAGRLADRIPRRHVMRLGLGALALSYVGVLAPPVSPAPLVLGTILSGAGLALLFVAFNPYVADLLGAHDRTAAYGRAGALGVLASALGPFLAALVFRAAPDDAVGLRVNGALFAAAALAGLALTLRLPSVRVPSTPAEERGRWHHAARAAAPVAATYVLMGAAYGMTQPWFTVYFLDTIRLPNEHWGYLLAAGTVASAAGSLVAGQLGRRHPPLRIALVGMSGLLAATLVFVLPVALPLLALGFVARSFFSTTAGPGMHATTMSRALTARRAETQAYTSVGWNSGWAIGGAVGGALLGAIGGALFPLGSALALAGVLVGMALLRLSPR